MCYIPTRVIKLFILLKKLFLEENIGLNSTDHDSSVRITR